NDVVDGEQAGGSNRAGVARFEARGKRAGVLAPLDELEHDVAVTANGGRLEGAASVVLFGRFQSGQGAPRPRPFKSANDVPNLDGDDTDPVAVLEDESADTVL